jgi:hypothetical protein
VPAHAGLLEDLPERRLLWPLACVEVALREGPDPVRLAAGADRGEVRPALEPFDEDAAGAELTFQFARLSSASILSPGTLGVRVPIHRSNLQEAFG